MNFRLTVFISVAQNLSFTKAATDLNISQPAVSRHIQELESAYKTQLFSRSGSSVRITPAGRVFLKHAIAISESYKTLQLEMNLLKGMFSGELRLGASTTIAQYVLPPIVARHIATYPDIRLSILTGNTAQVECALEENRIDLGLIEGIHRKPALKYIHFKKDELVLVTSAQNRIKDEISLEELSHLPLVLREPGSGTLEVIERALIENGRKLSEMNILLQLGTTEGIKLFLQNNHSVFAILSVAAVGKELLGNDLKVIEVDGVDLGREFAFVTAQGAKNVLKEQFLHFAVRP